MSTAPTARRPLGVLTESILNSPKRNVRQGPLAKTPIKSDAKLKAVNKTTIEILDDKPEKIVDVASVSRRSKSGTKASNLVKVTFPPGNMGLDLEPLISSVSPERLIGCRIKDFYFGVDHTGIDEDSLRAAIGPGHIIASINGQEVLFAQFMDILEKLRQLKHEQRTICFKTLSTEESSGISGIRSPGNHYFVFSPDREHTAISSPRVSTPNRSQRIDASMLSPLSNSKDGVRKTGTSLRPAIITRPEAPLLTVASTDLKLNLLLSPRDVKRLSKLNNQSELLSSPPQSPQKVIQSFISASEEDETRSLARNTGICSTQPIHSGHSKDDDISVGSLHSSSSNDDDSAGIISMADAPKAALDSDFSHKLVDVGAAIGHTVFSAAELVGYSAEHIVGSAIPVYSAREMKDVVAKKHTLLQELSKTCMLLGLSEQRQSTLESQLQRLKDAEERAEENRRHAEERYRQACNRFEGASMELAAVQADRDAWSARAHAAETEITVLRGEVRDGTDQISTLNSEIEIVKSQCASYRGSIDHLEQAVIDAKQGTRMLQQTLSSVRLELDMEKAVHEKDLETWQAQFDRMEEEQRQLKEELETTLIEASDRFASLEEEKYSIEKEKLKLQEAFSKAASVHKDEIQNLRDSMMAQQEWQRERLQEKDIELASLRATVAEISRKDLEATKQAAADQLRIKELAEVKNAADREIAVASHTAKTLEVKLQSITEEKEELLKINGNLQSELTRNSSVIDDLTEELKSMGAKYRATKTELNELKTQKQHVEEKSSSLAKQIAAAREEATASSDSWKQVVALLKVQLEEKEQEMSLAIFKASLDEKIAREALESERNDLLSQASILNEEKASLVNRLLENQALLTSVRLEAQQQQERQQDAYSEISSSLNSQQRVNAELESSLISRGSEVQALLKKVAVAEEQITDIQILLNRSNEKATALSALVDEKTLQNKELTDEMGLMKQGNADLVRLNDELEKARVELCERFEEEQMANIATLRSEVEAGLSDITELTQSIKAEKDYSAKIEASLKEKEAVIERLEEQAHKNTSTYEAKLADSIAERDELTSTIVGLKEIIDANTRLISSQEATMLSQREALHQKSSELDALSRTCIDIESRVLSYQRFEGEHAIVADLLHECQDQLKAETDRCSELASTLEVFRATCETQEADIKMAHVKKEELERQIDVLESKITEQDIEILALQAAEKELTVSLQDSTARMDCLSNELQTEVDAHNLLKSSINADQRMHSAALQELHAIKLSYNVLSEEVVSLQETLASNQTTLVYKQELLSGREKEISSLNEQLKLIKEKESKQAYTNSRQDESYRRHLQEVSLVVRSIHEKLADGMVNEETNFSLTSDVYGDVDIFYDESTSIDILLPALIVRMKDMYVSINQLQEHFAGKEEVLIAARDRELVKAVSAVQSNSQLQQELSNLRIDSEQKDVRIARFTESIDVLTQNHGMISEELNGYKHQLLNYQHKEKLLKDQIYESFSDLKRQLATLQQESQTEIAVVCEETAFLVKKSANVLIRQVVSAQRKEKEALNDFKIFKEDTIAQNTDTIEKLTEYDGAVDMLETENFELQKVIKDYQTQLESALSDRDNLMNDRNALLELKTEYGIAMDTMKLLTRDSNQTKEDLETLRSRESSLCREYETQIKASKEEQVDLEKKLKASEKILKGMHGEIAALREKLSEAEKSSKEATEAISSALEKRILELVEERDTAIDCMEVLRLDAEAREVALKEELDYAIEGYRVDRALLIKSFESSSSTRENFESSALDNKKADLILGQKSEEIMNMQAVLAFLKQKISIVEGERDAEIDKYQKLLLESEFTEKSLKDELNAAVEGYRMDRSLLVGRYEEQLRAAASLKSAETDRRKQLELQHLNEQMQMEHDNEMKAQRSIEDALNKNIDDLRSVINSLQSDIDCHKEEYESAAMEWKQEKSELTRLISALRTEAAELSALKFSVEEDLASSSVRIASLEDEMAAAHSRSRRSIAEAAKTKKQLDMTLSELQKITESYTIVRGTHEKCESRLEEVKEKLSRSEEVCKQFLGRSADTESTISSLRESLETAIAERDVVQSELSACRQNMFFSSKQSQDSKLIIEKLTSECESMKTKLVTTESKLLVALSATEEYRCNDKTAQNWEIEKATMCQKIDSLSALVVEQQKALDAASAYEAESGSNRAVFQKIATDADAQAKRFGDQVIELSRLLASSQGEILHLKSQLKEKRSELKAMNEAVTSMLTGDSSVVGTKHTVSIAAKSFLSPSGVGETLTSPSVQQQMVWRDELWTQALDIQSSVTDVATAIDSVSPMIEQYRKSKCTDEPLSPTNSNNSPPARNTRMKVAASLKKGVGERPEIPSAESLSVRIQYVLEQLHNFQTVLLSPPWNDETITDVATEIISGNIVPLKPSHRRRAFGSNINALVMKALIHMLVKVVRSRTPKNDKNISCNNANRMLVKPTTIFAEDEAGINYRSANLDTRLYERAAYDMMNESNTSSIWNVSDESDTGGEYSLEEDMVRLHSSC